MKIAIVGPTHPYKGGIAQHTTELAHHLKAAGHVVDIISWSKQYPFFYPGVQFVVEDKPELPIFPHIKRVLSWRNPVGWLRWGHKLRKYDKVIFAWYVPTIQGPIYLTMLKAIGKKGPETIMLCHNIIRHGAGGNDLKIVRVVFNQAQQILVHTDAQAQQVVNLTRTPLSVASMPAHLPGHPDTRNHPSKLQSHLLFFGLVRKYKGVDVLIRALAEVPDVSLTIAGEMWGKQQESLELLISELKLGKRVTLLPGYVAADDIGGLFHEADALVMPYRSGTASQTSELAFAHGIPVIATKVGSMPRQIRDGVDGLLCEPDDVIDLTSAIKRFYEPGVAASLRAHIPRSTAESDWQHYVSVVTQSK